MKNQIRNACKKQAHSAYKKHFLLLAFFTTVSSLNLQASLPRLLLFGPSPKATSLWLPVSASQANLPVFGPETKEQYDLGQELITAALNGQLEEARGLIAQGVNVNAANIYGETPLHYAVNWGRTEVIKLLLATPGILINATDQWGYTPLHSAANYGRTEVVKLLLATPGILVNAKNEQGDTPLHCAADWSCTEVVRLFLSFSNGNTQLHNAALWNLPESVALLLSHAKKPARKS